MSLAVQFIDQSVGAIEWLWDFGDGDFALTQHPLHVFPADGTYDVTLYVANAYGFIDAITKPVTVSGDAPIMCFLFFSDNNVAAIPSPSSCNPIPCSIIPSGGEFGINDPCIHRLHAAPLRCCGVAARITPPPGGTWLDVTQVTARFKWKYTGGYSGIWYGIRKNGVTTWSTGNQLGYNDNAWHTLIFNQPDFGVASNIDIYVYSDSGGTSYAGQEMWLDSILLYGIATTGIGFQCF